MPQPTKKERREAARAERIESEQGAAAAAARKRRLGIFGGLVVAAIAVVAIAIAVTSGGDKKTSSGDLADVAKVNKLYAGIPQNGITLGDPTAKATIVVFADPQCPFCRDFELTELPEVIQKQVRTGKARMVLRMRAFLGDDSVTAANALYGAAEQNKMFQTSGILYHNQGEENTGWVTDKRVREILGAVPGMDVDKALKSTAGTAKLGEAESLAKRYGSQSTPDVYVGTSENDANKTGATAADITKAVGEIAK